jgi:hypothetical protein
MIDSAQAFLQSEDTHFQHPFFVHQITRGCERFRVIEKSVSILFTHAPFWLRNTLGRFDSVTKSSPRQTVFSLHWMAMSSMVKTFSRNKFLNGIHAMLVSSFPAGKFLAATWSCSFP